MLVLKLAWRNLLRNRRRTLITIFSIASGCALSFFFFAFQAGVHKKTIDDATRMLAGQITVEHPQYRDAPKPSLFVPSVAKVKTVAEKMPDVELVKPLCLGNGVVSSAAGGIGIGFLGVEPDREKELSQIARSIVKGRFLESSDVDIKGVVIGERLADRLHVDVGNKLVLTTTNAQGDVVEELLRVVGIFKLGSATMDGALIELPIAVVRRVMGLTEDQATQVGLVLKRPEAQAMVLAETKRALAGENLAVHPWETLLPAIATWVSAGDRANQVMCGVVLFLASFAILNTILMSVIERKREFAMLLALGTPPQLLRIQVFVETLMLGVLGSGIGLALGASFAYAGQKNGIDMSDSGAAGTVGGMALDPHVRPALSTEDAVFVAVVVLVVTTLIAIYPTLRSSRVDVANTLRSQ